MNKEIEAEGYAREVIRRIQQMRKDMKLDVEEFIKVEIKAPDTIEVHFKSWKEHIMKETRATEMYFVDEPSGEYSVSWEVEKNNVKISISSLHMKNGADGKKKDQD